jgi:hypothetical protein
MPPFLGTGCRTALAFVVLSATSGAAWAGGRSSVAITATPIQGVIGVTRALTICGMRRGGPYEARVRGFAVLWRPQGLGTYIGELTTRPMTYATWLRTKFPLPHSLLFGITPDVRAAHGPMPIFKWAVMKGKIRCNPTFIIVQSYRAARR